MKKNIAHMMRTLWRSTQAGRRGSPGKGVGRQQRREGSNPSFSVNPISYYKIEDENRIKKLLTNVDERDILIKLICKTEMSSVKKAKNKFKNVVDKRL